ncbi:polymorphic toxin-type HINT domain-containing protein [Actinacidiphila sp. DG2A-62]|uniref:polymorphic toxin-type HINT domain-containing protein n=1 Tax=Actinacidiphila sp. DG2A-62 TaxID=3108821 RepID=UPI002DBA1FB0|nr:polymorphic toxin-type HINT domain-containing protein [Actinacidiphila sp. DG2A-62]MEC3997047.1 polymorphic toxin-type HINT domain-containing protein [Actinacidiphila sp. DG2A-62]
MQQVDYPGVDATKATTDPNRAGSVTTTGPATDSSQQLGYDDAGDTITRTTNATGTGAGTTHQALTYDVQGRTATATTTGPDGTAHTSSYLYGGDGSLLEQDDDGTKTLFLFGGVEQITLNTQGGASTENAIRSYTGPDGTEIIRDSSGKLSYQLAGLQGTGTLLVNAANDAVTRRFYDPYGNTRGALPSAWVSPYDTRGFLSQPSDPGSGLDLLGARQYDPVQGRFLSPDPIFEAGDPSQMGGYTYAADNPASGSDPTGMDNWWADPTANTPTMPGAPPITQHQAQEEGFGADCTATTCSDYNAQQADADRAAIEAQSKKEAASAARAKLEKGAVAEAAHRHCSWYNVGCQVEVHAEQILLAALIALAIVAAIALVATAPEIAVAAGQAFLEASAGGAGASMATVAASAAGVSVAAETAGLDTVAAGSAVVADLAGADSFTAGEGHGGGGGGRRASGGSSGDCSFSPDTPVLMSAGKTKPIGKIKAGDEVESADPSTGKHKGPRKVQAIWINHDKDLLDVTVEGADGKKGTLHTTSNHPFWDDTDKAWVAAGNLKPGDALNTATNTHVTVLATQATPGTANRWNLTVQQLHTYYVVAGGTPILVHNTGCPTNSAQADLPVHSQPTRFYARAGEMLDRVAGNPTSDEQMYGSVDAGHGGVSALSNEDLIRFGGPNGREPITGFREYVPGDDINFPGSRLNIVDGNNRTAEIANRVLSGRMDPNTLVEIMIGGR